MTLAQLEENAVEKAVKDAVRDSTDLNEGGVRGSFKAMVRSNYGVKLGAEGYGGSSLDKLKQLLHDVQVWDKWIFW